MANSNLVIGQSNVFGVVLAIYAIHGVNRWAGSLLFDYESTLDIDLDGAGVRSGVGWKGFSRLGRRHGRLCCSETV